MGICTLLCPKGFLPLRKRRSDCLRYDWEAFLQLKTLVGKIWHALSDKALSMISLTSWLHSVKIACLLRVFMLIIPAIFNYHTILVFRCCMIINHLDFMISGDYYVRDIEVWGI